MLYYMFLWSLFLLFCPPSIGFFLDRVVPNALPVNQEGSIKLYGSGLENTATVTFKSIDNMTVIATTPSTTSSDMVTIVVTHGVEEYTTIEIKNNADQTAPSRLLFNFYKQPSFKCCEPALVPFSGGIRATIYGVDFFFSDTISIKLNAGWTQKTIHGSDLVRFKNSTTLTFRTPPTTYATDYSGNFSVIVSLAMNGIHWVEMVMGQSSGLTYETADPVKAAFIYLDEIQDKGWTFAQNIGRKDVELVYQGSLLTDYVQNVEESFDKSSHIYRETLEEIMSYCKQNFSLIFAGSFGHMDPCIEAAVTDECKRTPTHIVHATGVNLPPVVSTMFAKVYQAKYLSGMTAGYLLGQTKRKSLCVGYLGGPRIPEVYRGFNAFLLGCRKANPDCIVKVIFAGEWNNRTLEGAIAEYMWEVEKCDIIAQETDTDEPSKVYERKGGYSIGYNSDQSAFIGSSVLTSSYVDWSVLFSFFIDKILNRESIPRDYWPGMTEDACGIFPFSNNVDVITRSRVTETWEELRNGNFKIFCKTPERPLKLANGKDVPAKEFGSNNCLTRESLDYMLFPLEGVVFPEPKDTQYGSVRYDQAGYENISAFLQFIHPEITYENPIWFLAIFFFFSTAGIILTCATFGFIVIKHENVWFKEHLVSQLIFILLGVLLMFVLPFLLLLQANDTLCQASRCIEHFIVFLIAPAICLKTLHLHLKYSIKPRTLTEAHKKVNDKKQSPDDGNHDPPSTKSDPPSTMRDPPSTNRLGSGFYGNAPPVEYTSPDGPNWTDDPRKLLAIGCSFLIFLTIYLLCWFLFDPPKAQRLAMPQRLVAQESKEFIFVCTEPTTWEIVLFILEILILLGALNLVVMHPKIPKKFNELKYIAFSLYTIFVISLIVIPVTLNLDQSYPELRYFLIIFGIQIVAFSILLALFVVKIVKVWNNEELELQPKRAPSLSSKAGRRPGSGIYGRSGDFDNASGISQTASSANMHTFSDSTSPAVSTYNLDNSMKPLKNKEEETTDSNKQGT